MSQQIERSIFTDVVSFCGAAFFMDYFKEFFMKKFFLTLVMVVTVAFCSLGITGCEALLTSGMQSGANGSSDSVKDENSLVESSTDNSLKNESNSEEDLENDNYSEGLEYTLLDNDTYAVTGIGTCTDKEIFLPNSYNGKAVTEIADSAFEGYNKLKGIEISDSVVSIGERAFSNCYKLAMVAIGKRVTLIEASAFSSCHSLAFVAVGASVNSIGEEAFDGCHKLIQVYNASALTIKAGSKDNGGIGYYAKSIATPIVGRIKVRIEYGYIIYEDKGDTILVGYMGEEKDLILPNGITEIYKYAFEAELFGLKGGGIKSVKIPDSVITIGFSAFACQKDLINVEFGNGVITIGDIAFTQCDSLTDIEIGDSVTTIGRSAFSHCDSLTNIKIGESVTTIGRSAFVGCDKLKSITLPFIGNIKDGTENTHFGYIFGADSYSDNRAEVPTSLKKVTITSATMISDYAFCGCYYFTSVVIGDSVKTIGRQAFYMCSSLTNVVIGKNVEVIERGAFVDSLTAVYYRGTVEDWEKISINSSHDGRLNNNGLLNATRYYYSESASTDTDYNYWYYDENGEIAVW